MMLLDAGLESRKLVLPFSWVEEPGSIEFS